MTFSDVEDLIRLLDENPSLKADLRQRLYDEQMAPDMREVRERYQASVKAIEEIHERLAANASRDAETAAFQARTDEFVAKAVDFQTRTDERLASHDQRFAEAAAFQARTDERLANHTQRFAEAAAFQARTDERLANHDQRFAETAAFQARTDERLAATEEFQVRTDARFDRLEARVDKSAIDIDDLRGKSLEAEFLRKAPSFLQDFIRRTKNLKIDDLPEVNDAIDDGRMTQREYGRLVSTDAIIRGQGQKTTETIHFAVEVSATIDEHDVSRAIESAEILRKLNFSARSAVFGNVIRSEAETMAAESDVLIILQAP